ncbi:MAG: BCCT family transporter [Bacteroidales bacterium]|nr:BCCT family transporter [Bacteroidales bacterium]
MEIKAFLRRIDWVKTLVPFAGMALLCALFILMPDASKDTLDRIGKFFRDDCGLYYGILGVGVFGLSIWVAFSKYGKVRLGNLEKPQYGDFMWGAMIFTSALAADILFYSLSEWAMYSADPHVQSMGDMQTWAPTFPLFHWGPIAWTFHIVLAVCFGFMLHVRARSRQCFSEACRPLLGSRMDKGWGRFIDIVAIIAMLAGIATTFSLATPLLSASVSEVTGLSDSRTLTIGILVLIAVIYTIAVLAGMKGISKLAKWCMYSFFLFLAYVLFAGGETRYILETGFQSLGNLVQNFVGMATYVDPLRETNFPQDWTLFYWAYWMAWTIGTPFFIGMISKGRTIRNTILGGYGWALAGTFTSFIILGNYGLAQQMKHGLDVIGIAASQDYYAAILAVLHTLPLAKIALVLLVVTMIMFYSTSFDTLTMIAATYSYKTIKPGEEPDKRIRTFWAIMFILLPIGLIFSESSMYGLQSVSIIAAFPVGIVIILMIISFFKDIRKYLTEK